jgi:hypothetical protein
MAIKKGHETPVSKLPGCDLCDEPAYADAQIPGHGSWANVCKEHFNSYGCVTGIGRGQVYVVQVPK